LKRFGTAEKNENNVSKSCVLTLFERIWNCREKFENSVSKACILMVLKRFGTAEKILKTLIVFKACILTVIETIRN